MKCNHYKDNFSLSFNLFLSKHYKAQIEVGLMDTEVAELFCTWVTRWRINCTKLMKKLVVRFQNLVDPYLGGHQTWREKDNLGMRGFIKTPSRPYLLTRRGCFELLDNEKNTSFCRV